MNVWIVFGSCEENVSLHYHQCLAVWPFVCGKNLNIANFCDSLNVLTVKLWWCIFSFAHSDHFWWPWPYFVLKLQQSAVTNSWNKKLHFSVSFNPVNMMLINICCVLPVRFSYQHFVVVLLCTNAIVFISSCNTDFHWQSSEQQIPLSLQYVMWMTNDSCHWVTTLQM